MIWVAHLISVIGNGLTAFGLGAYVVIKTGQTEEYARIGLMASLPMAVLAPFIGVLVDRWHRRSSLLISEGVGCVVSFALAGVAWRGDLPIWCIYLSSLVGSTAIAFTWPALSAITAVLVPRNQLGRATALLSFTDATGMLLGPVFGGLVMLGGGLRGILVADVVSFVLAIALLVFVAKIPDIPKSIHETGPPSMFGEVRFALEYVKARPGLYRMLWFFLFSNSLRTLGRTVLFPMLFFFFRTDRAGFLTSLEGVGIIAATLLVTIFGTPRNRIPILIIFNSLSACTLLFLGLPPSFLLYASCYFSLAFFGNLGYTCNQAVWQSKVEPAIQGRVFSIRRMISQMGTPLSLLLAGPLTDHFFVPAMKPGGLLTPYLAPLFGTSAGAGQRVFLLLLGICTVVNSVAAWRNDHIRNIDIELPDFHELTLSHA